MKILGNRVLVSRLEEEKKEGFQAVEVQDNFVNKGKIEQIGDVGLGMSSIVFIEVGNIILFSKYSPNTQEVEIEGKKMKIINVEDILSVL